MSRLDELRAHFEQDRFAMGIGIVIDDADENSAQCSLELTEQHLNARGVGQGGVIFTLADFTFAVAANYQALNTVTLDSTIHFLKAANGKKLIAKAICEHRSRSICVYRVEITDECGRLISRVSVTGFIVQEK